ncbi:hypothetical protein JCM17960_21430 [Magnetospira thiophila]
MSFSATLTYTSYLLLAVIWTAILSLYIRHLKIQAKVGTTVHLLLIILTIDAFRTLLESIYFGAARSSDAGVLPQWVGHLLNQSQYLVLPKLVNLVAALLVFFLLGRRFLPLLIAEESDKAAQIERQQREIESRRRVEMALVEEKRKAEKYLDMAGVMFIALDRQGRITLVNRKASEILGYTEQELLGRKWFDLLPEKEAESIENLFRKMIARETLIAPEYQNAVLTKDGRIRLIQWQNIFLRDDEDRVTGILSSGLDVTEQRATERENRRLSHRTQQILDAAAEGIVGLDAEARIRFVNPAALAAFKRTEEALVGEPFATLVCRAPEDQRAQPVRQEKCALFETLAEGEVKRADDETFWRGDGRAFPVEYVCAPIFEGGVLEGAVLIFRDISRRKAIEAELRRSNQELQQFAYVASHDLQAPLRMISSYLRLLEQQKAPQLDEAAREYLQHAAGGAQRMDALIRDLLDYARVTTHERPLEPVSLNAVVETARANLSAEIELRGAEVSVEDLPVVLGDQIQLERLMQNLIGNALKYTAADRVPQVHISPARRVNKWIITVSDNGIGIAPEHLERVFGIFQRLHAPGEYEGTGVGLAVCKRIVERHDGDIWATSTPGRGSAFHFTLPVMPESQEAAR